MTVFENLLNDVFNLERPAKEEPEIEEVKGE